ncbi:unnamed protein product [Hydatigera taeniaeformis]|uniref:Uncharacterized protein n=1 Tax=Hydatigena taeniaeformis TaxID=6205 RepID=A0A0R3WKP3_HYDTA|nr:unnamed protein product [Hydatigera taeniaeformis]
MYHLSCIGLLSIAAIVLAVPMSQPPSEFTIMEQRVITGLLEKHKLRDIIRIMLVIEEKRLVKQPTTPVPVSAGTEIAENVPRPVVPTRKDYDLTNMAGVEKGITTPPHIPRHRFYDENIWRQALSEI